ncbi:MAG TPA: hypothetical protein VF058_10020 [Actinomycetota bacterium]
MGTRSRARLATTAILASFGAVAVLASRPNAPFTPFLHPGDRSPLPLRELSRLLGLDALDRDVAALVGAALLVASAIAFVYAARVAWRGDLSVSRVIWVGVALHVLAFVLPLFLSRDVYSYAYYGRMVSRYGVNPYLFTPGQFLQDPFYLYVSHFWIDSPSVYGPAFSALAGWATGIASSVPGTVDAFKLVAAVAGVGTMLAVVAAARQVRPRRAAFAGLLIGWNPVLIFHNVAGGHNDALVGLAVALAALLVLSRRDVLATGVLVLGCLVKATAVIPLAMLVVGSVAARPKGRRLRSLAAHAAMGLVVGLPFVIRFFSLEDPSMGQLELATRQGWLAPSRFLVVTLREAVNAVAGETAGDLTSALIRIVFPVVLALVLVSIGRHVARRPDRIRPELIVAAMGWATLFGLMMAPILLPWYAAWMIPLAWLLPKPARGGAIFISVALVITELMSEPTRSPRVWEVMVIWLHWVATPIVLAVLVRLLLELRARLRMGPAEGASDPLLTERPILRSRVLRILDRAVSGREDVADEGERPGEGGAASSRGEREPVGG